MVFYNLGKGFTIRALLGANCTDRIVEIHAILNSSLAFYSQQANPIPDYLVSCCGTATHKSLHQSAINPIQFGLFISGRFGW